MKTIALTLSVTVLMSLSSCVSDSNSAVSSENEYTNSSVSETTSPNNMDNAPNIAELKDKFPEYFELGDFKGIEVYVWQMAENSYRCGMMSGTNRNKTIDEIMELQSRSLSIDEAKAILNEIGVNKEDIIVIPISQPYSSYVYEINDEYSERVKQLFE